MDIENDEKLLRNLRGRVEYANHSSRRQFSEEEMQALCRDTERRSRESGSAPTAPAGEDYSVVNARRQLEILSL